MDKFSFRCTKYYSDPRDPRSPGSSTQIFQRGEALKITGARFFPEDGAHELEIKFEDGDQEASRKMTVVVDGEKVKEVELKENSVGNARCTVNGREVEFEWDVSISSAEFYFSYEGTDRIGMVGVE